MAPRTLPYWNVVKEKTQDHWLELRDPEGWFSAVVKWDGCIHLYSYANISLNDRKDGYEDTCDDYMHICDLDDFEKCLKELREQATKHFGEYPKL